MLPSFSLLLLCPFSLCQISITESYFSLSLHMTFYSQVENTATPKIPCSVFMNVLQLLLFCHHHSMTVLPSSSIQGTWLTAKPLGEWHGLRAVFWGEARQNIQDKCLYANVVCMPSVK